MYRDDERPETLLETEVPADIAAVIKVIEIANSPIAGRIPDFDTFAATRPARTG
ncbi:hypothetical protein [Nonomuraea sp. NPDC050783]|uniref:hypothetical protein n=1 Tax=Nonomuraea sp. NPDC050783 TaxID=3154634 RepID=UPI0034677B32